MSGATAAHLRWTAAELIMGLPPRERERPRKRPHTRAVA